VKRFIFILLGLIYICPSPASAQWGPAPTESQWARPSESAQTCRAFLAHPAEFGDLPFIYSGNCPSGFAQGTQTVTASPEGSPRGTTFTISSTFQNGRTTGRTVIRSNFGISFDGTINPNGVVIGRTSFPDGHIQEGESRNGLVWTGTVIRPTNLGGGTVHFVSGQRVSPGSVAREQETSVASAATPVRPHIAPSPTLARIRLGRSTCLADLPNQMYTIEGEFPGRCVNDRYTGRAQIALTPRAGSDYPAQHAEVTFQDGLVVGDVDVTYPTFGERYRGSYQNWLPFTGRSERNVGNRNYEITEWSGGASSGVRTEYRPPSEAELALGRIVTGLATAAVDCAVGACAEQRCTERRAHREQQARNNDLAAQADQLRVARQQNEARAQEERDGWARVAAQQETDRHNSQAAIEEGMRRAGLDPSGNPPPQPVQVARANPPPPLITTNRPAFGGATGAPEFGGSTSPQGDRPILTTNPPEVPAPEPASAPYSPNRGQPIPDPVRGLEPPTPAVPVPGLPEPTPYNPNSAPLPPAPVQPPRQDDTLGTGPAPSYPVAQPVPVANSVASNQPADVVSRPPVTPVSSTPRAATLATPMRIAPTNAGELAPTVPLEWSPVSGATYYELAVRDLTTNPFVVDQPVYNTVFHRAPYPSGRTFRWTVRACNQSGCGGWSTPWEFRTAAETPSDSCRIEVRFKPAGIISNHAFIITTDSASVTYFRGGPEFQEDRLGALDRRPSDFWGRIVTRSGTYSQGTIDWVNRPSAVIQVRLLETNCDNINRQFVKYLTDIQLSGTIYDPLQRNSNSVIRELLERTRFRYLAPPVSAVAWDSQLP
jgi:hypothetical protein